VVGALSSRSWRRECTIRFGTRRTDQPPDDDHIACQLRLLSTAVGLVLGGVTYETFAATGRP
jgi:hypothetical protein